MPPPESAEAKDAEQIFAASVAEVITSENPLEVLARRVIEQKIPLDYLEPLQEVQEKLDGVFGLRERTEVLLKMQQQKELPEKLFTALAMAVIAEEKSGLELLKDFLKKRKGEIEDQYKNEPPPRSVLEDLTNRAGRFLVKEAGELRGKYGENIPEEELGKFRAGAQSIDKKTHSYARSQMGGAALQVAEADDPSRQKFVAELMDRFGLIFGEEQKQALVSSYELYRALWKKYEEAGMSGQEVLESKPDRRLLHTITSMDKIAFLARGWLSQNQELNKEQRSELRVQLEALEDFLLKRGHIDIKERIAEAQKKEKRDKSMQKEVRGLVGLEQELTETYSQANILKGMEESVKETGEDIKRGVQELVASGPLGHRALIEKILFLGSLQNNKVADLLHTFSRQPQEVEPAAPLLKLGQEAKYTPDDLQVVLERKAASAQGDNAGVIGVLLRHKNYLEKIELARLLGLFSEEDKQGYLGYLEAGIAVREERARELEASIDELEGLDRSKLSAKDLERAEKEIIQRRKSVSELRNHIAEIKKGEKTP